MGGGAVSRGGRLSGGRLQLYINDIFNLCPSGPLHGQRHGLFYFLWRGGKRENEAGDLCLFCPDCGCGRGDECAGDGAAGSNHLMARCAHRSTGLDGRVFADYFFRYLF